MDTNSNETASTEAEPPLQLDISAEPSLQLDTTPCDNLQLTEGQRTVALRLDFKIGNHCQKEDFFTFSNDGSLTIESSPVGINVQKGDVLVRYFNDDVRGWSLDRFNTEKWNRLEEPTRVELLIFRKGYNPDDMDRNVKKKVRNCLLCSMHFF